MVALQEAKNRCSAIADAASRGSPQLVMRRGRPLVAIVSYELYREKICPESRPNIAEAFMRCPVDIDLAALIPPRTTAPGRAHPVTAFGKEG